ncbi:MAG: hypothetical protein J1F66_04940 [Clostridiales bacterium]|nr:hypothetical protein [Clostridiales bacterium]
MKVVSVDKKLIKTFVDFPDKLYAGDGNYVPYIKGDLTKTLKKLLLQDKTYDALLVVEDKTVLGRILLTVDKNKQLNTEKCGFFSMFECVDDQEVCNLLLDASVKLLKERGAKYISGTYYPYDQDNRRGILVEGFEEPPLIFTSYNKPYYSTLLTNYGLVKQTDALQYKLNLDTVDHEKYIRLSEFSKERFNYRVDTLDWNNIDRDIDDVHTVMQAATNEIIYQDAPTIEALQNIVKGWKSYLNKDYIVIARSNTTNEPLGVMMALPDYFQVFKKMRGRMDLKGLYAFATERKKIKSARAMLQYVIPKYQNLGVTMALYFKLLQGILNNGVTRLEAGTVMENNVQSNEAIKSVGGKLAHVYRIYYKEI